MYKTLSICLTMLTFCSAACAGDNDVTRLSCKVSLANTKRIVEIPVEVYFAAKVVNGYKADINDSTIKWKSGSLVITIDRYSGAFLGISDDGLINSGQCIKVTDRKF